MHFKTTARVVGGLFLLAMVTSLAGGIWLEAIMAAPDMLETVSASETQVAGGVLLELVNAAAVVGIAAGLYPLLKRQSEALALGYLGLRAVESAVLAVAAAAPVALVALSQDSVAAGAAGVASYDVAGSAVMAAREALVGLLTPFFFGLAGLVLYTLLFQTKLVPRFISVWGLIAVVLMLGWNVLEAFGVRISAGMVLALPLILNEIFLGLWLIAKGFDPAAVMSGQAGAA